MDRFNHKHADSVNLGIDLSHKKDGVINPNELDDYFEQQLRQRSLSGCKGRLRDWIDEGTLDGIAKIPTAIKKMEVVFHDLWETFDDDRPLEYNRLQWNEQYLDDALNYLKWNFSQRRLQHIIEVKKFIAERNSVPGKVNDEISTLQDCRIRQAEKNHNNTRKTHWLVDKLRRLFKR